MTVLEYMTKHRGYRVTACSTSGASVLYQFAKSGKPKVSIESLPDGMLKVSVGDDIRIIPNPAVIKAALSESMSDDEATLRMLSQVLDKMLRRARGEIEGAVQDQMSRHARQKM